MIRRTRPAMTAAAALLAVTMAVPATAQDPGASDAGTSSETVDHVANFPYELRHGATLPSGTDVEFATLGGTPGPVSRVAGDDRSETAAEVARSVHGTGPVETVLLARSDEYADALAGSALAAALQAPLLLTRPDALDPVSDLAIHELGATEVVVLGGPGAISEAVTTGLRDEGLAVRRIQGADRFETAAAIADEIGGDGPVTLVEGQHADPARGWPDALSAAQLRAPILLATAGTLPDVTATALDGRDVTVLGGPAALSDTVFRAAEQRASSVDRLFGATRYATSVAAAEEAIARGSSAADVWVATGAAFPDGLAAGAAAAIQQGVLLLTDGGDAPTADTAAFVRDHADDVDHLRMAGGSAAIAAGTEAAFTDLLGAGVPGREFAIAGSYRNGQQFFDITDPEHVEHVGAYDCALAQSDIQVFTRDGRTYVATTADDGYAGEKVVESRCFEELGIETVEEMTGTVIVDITDPTAPEAVSFVPVAQGSHNQTVHPSGRWLYNSNSDLVTSVAEEMPAIEVFDITDLANPVKAGELELPVQPIGLGTESHDVTFSEDGTRAYSAALSQTVVIDTTNPAAPEVLSTIIDPTINVHHQSDPVTIGGTEYLVITDELAGAAGSPCPGGGLHVYDISDETQPLKAGYWAIPEFRPTGLGTGTGESLTCTAHVLRMHEDAEVMTIAWYNAGVWVVDISGIAGVQQGVGGTELPLPGMRTLGFMWFEDSDTWSVKTNHIAEDGSMYLYGNDLARGFDVYRYTPAADGVPDEMLGTWLSGSALASLPLRATSAEAERWQVRCLLPPPA